MYIDIIGGLHVTNTLKRKFILFT